MMPSDVEVKVRNGPIALRNGFYAVPPGKVAAVVTHLEMTGRPPSRPVADAGRFRIRRVEAPDADWYRDLYRRVGADWLWFSRLRMKPAALAKIIGHPRVEVYALRAGGAAGRGEDEGLLELDFRREGECELAFLGVTAALIGQGAGRALMNHAIERAWARPIRRFWVHTCTLDHPGALGFYERSGFKAYAREIEVADDPRLKEVLPATAAPHVPILRRNRLTG